MSARSPLAPEPTPEGIDLRHYVEVLWHRKRLIGACVLVGILLAGVYTLLAPKSYQSKAVVEVKPTLVDLADLATAGLDKALSMDNERQVASSQAIANLAAQTIGWPGTPQSLLKHVSVDNPTDTQVLEVTYVGSSGLEAQRGAAAFADAYLHYRQGKAEDSVNGQKQALQADIQSNNQAIDDALAQARESKDPKVDQQAQQAKAEALQAIAIDKGKLADLESINTDPGAVIAAPNDPNGQSSPRPKLNLVMGVSSDSSSAPAGR